MFDYKTISDRFGSNDKEMLPSEAEELRSLLMQIQPDDLVSIEDHRQYIRLVAKFRLHVERSNKLNGANYLNTIKSLLSVGADGLYTNDLRFLFELIQNVDDCVYDDPADARLNVRFDTNLGRIIFEYNEAGFRPFDVFSITGIAEESKNITPDKIEIGEKGIGFKSVFGVADKVLIQSGLFSFVLHGDNITIPIDSYNEFSGIKGTRLTLYLKTDHPSKGDNELAKERGQKCLEMYQKITDLYNGVKRKDALFRNNPVLFLNKLTYLKFYLKSDRFVEFNIPRNPFVADQFSCEDDVVISCARNDGSLVEITNTVHCYRYTYPIDYDQEMCISRYGKDTVFLNGKKLFLQVLVPYPEDIQVTGDGVLYSFLPTQVKTTVPMVCHIPFKLTNSREYVDSQNNNAWFLHSCNKFSEFLGLVYRDLAKRLREQILYYLPKAKSYFFAIDSGNDTLLCLKVPTLHANTFLSQPVFHAGDSYLSNSQIYSYCQQEAVKNPAKLAELLPVTLKYFEGPTGVDVSNYGITVMRNAYQELFNKALNSNDICGAAFDYLDEAACDYRKLIEGTGEKSISLPCLITISRHKQCMNALRSMAEERIRDGRPLRFSVFTSTQNILSQLSADEKLTADDFEGNARDYLKRIKYTFATADLEKDGYFPADNTIILSSHSPLDSLGDFCLRVGDKRFSVTQAMRSASIALDTASSEITGTDYLRLLQQVRRNVFKALGTKGYSNYIKVIQDLGTSPKRFLFELLQNADDCVYPDGCIPSFCLKTENTYLSTEYNEVGFSRENVRAITAIGESTKRLLTANQYQEIGEKGIGFKSVFGIADEVIIYSGGFLFSLKADTPTIPNLLKNDAAANAFFSTGQGTQMLFSLREEISDALFSPENLLLSCLCLRKLKRLSFIGTTVSISDTNDTRIIVIEDREGHIKAFEFNTFRKEISIPANMITGSQKAGTLCYSFYLPTKPMSGIRYWLYNGLPTEVEMAVPMSIDSPFELEASREQIKQSEWNNYVKTQLYESYAEMLEQVAPRYQIELMQFVGITTKGNVTQPILFKSSDWLNKFDVISLLQSKRIIPTCDASFISSPLDCKNRIKMYPAAIHYIMRNADSIKSIPARRMVAPTNNEVYLSKLTHLGVETVEPSLAVQFLTNHTTSTLMEREDFRRLLYSLLKREEYSGIRKELQQISFIPVKPKLNDPTTFISWRTGIFVDDTVLRSPESYWVLNTDILGKDNLESMLSVSVNVMNDLYRQAMYRAELEKYINETDLKKRFFFFDNEFRNNRQKLQKERSLLIGGRERIPLITENGLCTAGKLFTCDKDEHYYTNPILQERIVAKRCEPFAKFLEFDDISIVTFEDLSIKEPLTADDVEAFLDRSLKYGRMILADCITEGLIDDALVHEYDLQGLKKTDLTEEYKYYEFPSEPVYNLQRLQQNIQGEISTAKRMVPVKVERIEQRIELQNGKTLPLDATDIRDKAITRYRPDINRTDCYCQACKSVKPEFLIEVNNIVPQPKYYWPQMRIALCLNCSKAFERLRRIDSVKEDFFDAIRAAETQSDIPIDIPIGDMSIHFTQTHLAEIQEILKTGKY